MFSPSLGDGNAYLVSGYPWVTGSMFEPGIFWKKIEFPVVSKCFTVINLDAGHLYPSGSSPGQKELYVFFGDTNVADTVLPDQVQNNHFVTIPDDKNGFVFDVKCKHFFIGCHDVLSLGGFQVFAELTNIQNKLFPHLQGPGIDE